MDNYIQEIKDLRLVWTYINTFGGNMNERNIMLNKHDNRRFTALFQGEKRLREAADYIEGVYRKAAIAIEQ